MPALIIWIFVTPADSPPYEQGERKQWQKKTRRKAVSSFLHYAYLIDAYMKYL